SFGERRHADERIDDARRSAYACTARSLRHLSLDLVQDRERSSNSVRTSSLPSRPPSIVERVFATYPSPGQHEAHAWPFCGVAKLFKSGDLPLAGLFVRAKLTFPRATLSLGEWHGREAIQGDSQEAEHVILRLCAR